MSTQSFKVEPDVEEASTDNQKALTATPTPHDDPWAVLETLPTPRKLLLLTILCLAIFLDTFNNSSLFAAIPPIAQQLDIPDSQSVWLLSAYQLTFAVLLLVSGRVSDLYNPKWVFVVGAFFMFAFSLAGGFERHKIPLIVLRAIAGTGAALSIPSAQHLIVHTFTDPATQAKALAAFSGMAAIGIVLGLILGAIVVTFASWPWVFYVSAIMAALIGISVILVVPNISRTGNRKETTAERISRFKRLDLLGVGTFTIALILFIFAVTSGSVDGWGSASVIAPLVISVVLAIIFFIYEARIPEDYAALPPKMWRYHNFAILVAIALIPLMWWASIFLLFSWYWEIVYGWTALKTAVHFLPIGIGVFPVLPLATGLQSKFNSKKTILLGHVLALTGTILLAFGNTSAKYWPIVFPGFLLGTAGGTLIYATTNIAILSATPPSASGVAAAVYNCALQTGSATGIAIVTSIQTSVQISRGGPNGFQGRSAGLWFIVGFVGVMGILFLIFYKDVDNSPVEGDVASTPTVQNVQAGPPEVHVTEVVDKRS